jgi:hypothetical protein
MYLNGTLVQTKNLTSENAMESDVKKILGGMGVALNVAK